MWKFGRLAKLDVHGTLSTHRFGTGQFGQTLHPRLRLLCFTGLGFEAIDEFLQVFALGLFFLETDLLQTQMLGALALETGVIAGVQLGFTFVQMQGMRTDTIKEFAVVRYQ